MSINNRSLNLSQRKTPISVKDRVSVTDGTGATGVLAYIAYPCTINAMNLAAFGLAGGHSMVINNTRFIVGSGVTVFNISSVFALQAYGTSGVISGGVSLPVAGSTLMRLMANDVIGYAFLGATVSLTQIVGEMIVTPSQDVKTYLGGLT